MSDNEKKACSHCHKESYCLPVGDNNSNLCFDCFRARTDAKETASEANTIEEVAVKAFAEFARENEIDIDKITGKDLGNMLVKNLATNIVMATHYGIHIRKLEVKNISEGIGAVGVEISFNEFDEKFLPHIREAMGKANVSGAKDDLPEHVKAAVQVQGNTVGKFNA